MPQAKKIFLVHERHETWRLRFKRSVYAACADCGDEVGWITVAEAARSSGLSEVEVFNRAGEMRLHSIEDDEGRLLICERSLTEGETK